MNPTNFSIQCSDQMMKKIEDHCFSETQIEVGGFLVGHLDGETAYVTNVFPAQHTVGASTQLTFTHDSWNAIYEQLEKEPEGSTLIGWFHSHPNFGVFLSDHDKFIQSNFFAQDGKITIVVDPIRGRRGWFFSESGKIRTYKEEVATDRKRLGVSDSDADQNIEAMLGGSKQGVSLPKVIAISAVMSLVSFVAGWTLTTSSATDKASQTTVSQLLAEVQLIQRVLDENGIGVVQIPTRPTAVATPKPTAVATPKPTAVATPNVTTPTATKSPNVKKSATATPSPKAIKAGQPCVQGRKDPEAKLNCVKNAAGKFVWKAGMPIAPVAPAPPPNPAAPTQPNDEPPVTEVP